MQVACSVRWSALYIVLQDMRASKAAVAADFSQAKVKVGNLEAALTRLKKEKQDKAAQHKASYSSCVCQAKQGCRNIVSADLCAPMLSTCVLLWPLTACMRCTLLSCLLRCLKTRI